MVPQAASAVGVVFLNSNDTAGLGLTTVLPGGTPVHLEATINIASVSGTWRDSSGNSGAFVFTPGASNGGNPRPVASGGVPAGSITAAHLASGAVGPAAIAANAVTGGSVVDGSLTSADLANGAVGPAQIAANAVTGNNIVNGSVTGADISNAFRVLSNERINVLLAPAASTTVVELLTPFVAPAAGSVIVNVSGAFNFGSLDPALVYCSITTGTNISTPYSVVVRDAAEPLYDRFVPFGGTRSFSVAAGSSTTFRLVCVASSQVSVWNLALTALFVASP